MKGSPMLDGKHILVTGGTGSLGRALVRRLLSGKLGKPAKVVVFSRDEAKQHEMRAEWNSTRVPTEDAAYRDYKRVLEFKIGDVRDYDSISAAVRDAQFVFHAAALKQVPSCEYEPLEAVKTNVLGASNVVRAILSPGADVEVALAISTDKACKPVNVMGMTKALQERIFINGNLGHRTKFLCVRYGNVISSRGSVIPLFLDQIRAGDRVFPKRLDAGRRRCATAPRRVRNGATAVGRRERLAVHPSGFFPASSRNSVANLAVTISQSSRRWMASRQVSPNRRATARMAAGSTVCARPRTRSIVSPGRSM